MQILIQIQNFKIFYLDISPSQLVYEIKSKIHSIEQIPINNQNLFYFGKLLENNKPISFYSIENNSIINLIEQTQGGVQIFIHSSNGRTINLDVEPTETIESIKNKIYIKENIPLNNQELIIKGEKMENKKKLGEYNLDSEISLFNIENEKEDNDDNNKPKKNIFIRILNFFNIFEWCLLLLSYIIIIIFFFVFKNDNYLNLVGAIIGVSATLFAGKGSPIGQVLIIIFSVIYAIVSYTNKLYGEMITYLGMTALIAIFALISWIRNSDHGQVRIYKLKLIEWIIILILTIVVTIGFYFLLKVLKTKNLIISTVSVFTSFLASVLTLKRSKYYALGYASNDCICVVLWIIASLDDIENVSIVTCFGAFLLNDIYGFINWNKLEKIQDEKEKNNNNQ